MNKTNSIVLTLFILILLGMSHYFSVQTLDRQREIVRNVVLFDTEIITKRHKSIPYTVKEGVFFDKWSNRTFQAPIDDDLYKSFVNGNKKSIEMQRAVSLDMVESTLYAGSGYRIMSAILFLVALISLFNGLFISRVLIPRRAQLLNNS